MDESNIMKNKSIGGFVSSNVHQTTFGEINTKSSNSPRLIEHAKR